MTFDEGHEGIAGLRDDNRTTLLDHVNAYDKADWLEDGVPSDWVPVSAWAWRW
jgi:hypothetical protein